MYSLDSLGTILILMAAAILVGLVAKQKRSKSNERDQKMNEPSAESKKGSILDRWSVRLALVGLGLGVFASISQGYASPKHIGFMIGLGIPFALILGTVGLIIDFFKRKK